MKGSSRDHARSPDAVTSGQPYPPEEVWALAFIISEAKAAYAMPWVSGQGFSVGIRSDDVARAILDAGYRRTDKQEEP